MNGRPLVRGEIAFAIARREDEAELRRALQANATDGWIRLALAREPDAFAAARVMGAHHGYLVARHIGSGEFVGMCEWSARDSYIGGEPRLLAYLGTLRVAPAYRHRMSVLKGGFEATRGLLHHKRATPYALTAIAADNHAALRLLGANLRGLPVYQPLETFSTFALRPRAAAQPAQVEAARRDDLPAIAVCLSRAYRQYQFAPLWPAHDLADPHRCAGLNSEDFLIIRRGPGIAACVALWDQSAFKQTLVQGYAGWLSKARPLVNLAAPVLGLPSLPAAGAPLRQVYLSHLAVQDHDSRAFLALIAAALAAAHRRGFSLALTGLATRHPFAAVLAHRYRAYEYRTLLHLVHWDRGRAPADVPAARLPHVEIAVM
jgi:hypothetical protein